jgi:peroxiredoxin
MKYIATSVVLLIIVVIAVIYYPSSPDEGDINDSNIPDENGGDNIGTNVGQTAPDFELTDTIGDRFNLEGYRGSVVIIDFMATWCNPCVQEMEELKNIYSDYYSKGVRIISIDIDDSESTEDLSQFKSNHECDWLFAPYGSGVGATYKVGVAGGTGIPTLFIINKEGVITNIHEGFTDYSQLSYELDMIV